MASKGGLSSNPALAALQRAKQEGQKGVGSSGIRPTSLDLAPSSSLSSRGSLGVPSSVGSPPAGSWQAPRQPSNLKHLEEDERSMLREGWWAKTDAGNMNVEDVKLKSESAGFVASPSLNTTRKLDFSSMLKEAAAPANAPPEPAVPVAAAAADVHPDPDVPVAAPSLPSAPAAGAPSGGEHHWWDKMDNKVLNEADQEQAKGTKSAFTPQFTGASGLTNKLEFGSPQP